MAALISLTLFALLMMAISYFGYRRYARPARIYERLGEPVVSAGAVALQPSGPPPPGWIVKVIQLVGEKVPISPQEATSVRRDLISAGYRSDMVVKIYYGIKVTAALAMIVLAFLFRDQVSNPVLRVVMIFFGGAAGYFGPGFLLDRRIRKRQTILRLSLPDALDMMVVAVEAGLGLDQAIQHVAREIQISHKELSEELSLVTLEMRAGKRRAEALRNLSERTGEPELQKLIAILIQTDRFGTSMGESLRSHSDFLRVRRRQEAEERANKVGVKLVFPIFFFILPSMLVVAAGPGLLQVFKFLFPMMRNFGQ
jgi:tight adherence protein C